jgi:hypothetical protein
MTSGYTKFEKNQSNLHWQESPALSISAPRFASDFLISAFNLNRISILRYVAGRNTTLTHKGTREQAIVLAGKMQANSNVEIVIFSASPGE